MSRVLIADDHAVVRAGYKQFLEAEAGITAIGETASGNETLDQLRQHEWDLLLMDIHMPDRSGLDILKHVTSGYPKVRVLIMSGLPEAQYAQKRAARRRQRLFVERRLAGGAAQSGAHGTGRTPLCECVACRINGG